MQQGEDASFQPKSCLWQQLAVPMKLRPNKWMIAGGNLLQQSLVGLSEINAIKQNLSESKDKGAVLENDRMILILKNQIK